MAEHHADIVIFGAGIAGLWTMNALKKRGYDVLLLEKNAIGSGQTIASQGIIHSGLKYALGGKILPLAKEISAMPQRWRDTLNDNCTAAPSQSLFIQKGFTGGIVKAATQKIFSVEEISDWPAEIKASGFEGSILSMNEPVLDIAEVLRQLAAPYTNCIKKLSMDPGFRRDDAGGISAIEINDQIIKAKIFIFTAAAGNEEIAKQLGNKIDMQKRPLLMGLMKNAPFPLYAHFVGASEKPVATITTHKIKDGTLVWYVGGSVAERAKDSDPEDVYNAAEQAFAKYMPDVDLSKIQWATLPIDRMEGKSGAWMPDTPTAHQEGNAFYCWPTKLAFAPLLADMISEKLKDVKPSNKESDWSFLPDVGFAETPWDKTRWKKRR